MPNKRKDAKLTPREYEVIRLSRLLQVIQYQRQRYIKASITIIQAIDIVIILTIIDIIVSPFKPIDTKKDKNIAKFV